MAAIDKIDRLKSQLNTSGLQQQNNPLFQVISTLIDATKQLLSASSSSSSDADLTALEAAVTALEQSTYLTSTDVTALLPNSRELIAGQNIEFDDFVAGERLVKTGNWSVLTNGDPVTPELIFAGGDVVMIYTP